MLDSDLGMVMRLNRIVNEHNLPWLCSTLAAIEANSSASVTKCAGRFNGGGGPGLNDRKS